MYELIDIVEDGATRLIKLTGQGKTQDRGRFSVLTKHRDMVYWSRVMEYA